MHTQEIQLHRIQAAGAELHVEVRGEGRPLLLVPGLPGDAGQFDAFAERLAAGHRVIAYDRRGYSRSPRPAGWAATSVAEQAADAAAVLEQVAGGEPAVVFGTSNGALVALELALSRPELVAGLVAHEPPLMSVLRDPESVQAALGEVVGPAFASGGPDAALEAFLRFAWGDAVLDGLDPGVRRRILAAGEVAMTIELPGTGPYRPDEAALAGLALPVAVLVGEAQLGPLFHEAAGWLAGALGTSVVASPGAHAAPIDRPGELATLLEELSRLW